MRASLKFASALTALASLYAVWSQPPAPVLAISRNLAENARQLDSVIASTGEQRITEKSWLPAGPLPKEWPAVPREPPSRDIFMPTPAAAPTFPSAVIPKQPQVIVEPQIPPPAQNFRFLGRFTSPDNKPMYWLADGEQSIPVSIGTVLPNGYVVREVTVDRIVVAYAPMGIRVDILVPPQPIE